MSRPRRIATIVHRWTGLAMAGFLAIVGLTGAIIAWNDQLERIFAPSMFVLPDRGAEHGRPLDPFMLRDAAERAVPGFAINDVDLTRQIDRPIMFGVEARPGGPAPAFNQIVLDPYDGRLRGKRNYGDLREGTINLIPFIYDLHDSLALGETGTLILGIVALFWTIDCFVGAYLTFPAKARDRRGPSDWMRRWGPSWLVRYRSSQYKLFYDLHRAGGLWPWALMVMIAWSSVSFNLRQVYQPVMAVTLGLEPSAQERPQADPMQPPGLDWRHAHAVGQKEMATLARQKGFTVKSERLMFYDPGTHTYSYRVLSSRDPGKTGNTQIQIDGDTGALGAISIPTGEFAGTTVTSWIADIHVGDVMGLAMRVVLTITGLAITMLSVTGVWLWWRKRAGRKLSRKRTVRS